MSKIALPVETSGRTGPVVHGPVDKVSGGHAVGVARRLRTGDHRERDQRPSHPSDRRTANQNNKTLSKSVYYHLIIIYGATLVSILRGVVQTDGIGSIVVCLDVSDRLDDCCRRVAVFPREVSDQGSVPVDSTRGNPFAVSVCNGCYKRLWSSNSNSESSATIATREVRERYLQATLPERCNESEVNTYTRESGTGTVYEVL